MDGLLRLLISLSLSGSVVTLLLLAGKPLLRERISRTWQYYIWLAAVLRLLLPVALPVNATGMLFEMLEAPRPAEAPAVSAVSPGLETAVFIPELDAAESGEGAAPSQGTETAGDSQGRPLSAYFAPVWAAVALALFVRKAAEYRSFVRFVRAGAAPPEDGALEDACIRACEAVGLRKPPPVYVNPMLTSPMLVGLLHPFIAVPCGALGEDADYLMLLHELTHRKRLDAWYKWMVQLAVCLHWFNPLAYVLRRETDRCCELACDEAVLRLLEREKHRAYGDTLLESAMRCGSYGSPAISVPLNEDARLLKERLGFIMRFKEKTRKHTALSVFLGVLVTAAALACGCATLAETPKVTSKASLLPPPPVEPPENKANGVVRSGKRFYCSTSFFENGYILQIEWNKAPESGEEQRQIMVDGQTFTLAFASKTKNYVDNEGLLEAAGMALREIRTNWAENPVTEPRITMVSGPYTEGAGELANKFYKDGNIVFFSAVSNKADRGTKETLLRKAYADGRVAEFSVLSDILSQEEAARLAKQAYQDSEIAFFSILSGSLSQEEKGRLAEQAYQEGNIAFFSILSNNLEDRPKEKLLDDTKETAKTSLWGSISEKVVKETVNGAVKESLWGIFDDSESASSVKEAAEFARRAYQDGKVDFFYNVDDALSDQERAALAKQAYKDGKIEFFYALDDVLSEQDQAALAKQAYKDGKIEFFYVLDDALSKQDRAALAKQAYDDGKVEFFYVLADALSEQERAALVKQAYKDNKVEFFYALRYAQE